MLAAAGALLGAASPPASAEEQPPILKAYGLDWIERVRDEAWPQPRHERPIICLLDTGVSVTPDTPSNSPAGPIVDRLALDGKSGEPQGNTFLHGHGTQMASIMVAPRNGYGTVGIFPQGRVLSIRVTEDDEVYITPDNVRRGVSECRRWSDEASAPVAAIVIAESNYEQREVDAPLWRQAADAAKRLKAVIVAALGNNPGAEIVPPVAVDDLVVVTAGDEVGAACGFVATQVPVGIRAPGCDATAPRTWPAGSSAATAAVGALIGAIAARRPGLEAADQRSVLGTATVVHGGATVLAGSVLKDSLFSGLVREPQGDSGSSNLQVAPDDAHSSAGRETRMWRPRVHARLRRGKLTVTRLDSARKGALVVQVVGQEPVRFGVRQRRKSWSIQGKPQRLKAWAESVRPGGWRSLARSAKINR